MQVLGNVKKLIHQVARVHTAQVAIVFIIPLLNEVLQAFVFIRELFFLAHPLKNLAELFQ